MEPRTEKDSGSAAPDLRGTIFSALGKIKCPKTAMLAVLGALGLANAVNLSPPTAGDGHPSPESMPFEAAMSLACNPMQADGTRRAALVRLSVLQKSIASAITQYESEVSGRATFCASLRPEREREHAITNRPK